MKQETRIKKMARLKMLSDKDREMVHVNCKECGKEMIMQYGSVRRRWSGRCRSCATKKQIAEGRFTWKGTHRLSDSRIYNTWRSMIKRCSLKSRNDYKDYGGRGITVCDEWKKFETFYKWSNESGYKEGLTIERIDVNGNYCPENCKWITMKEQAKNKRTAYEKGKGLKLTSEQVDEIRNLTIDGKSKKDIAKKYCVSLGTIYHIIYGKSWKIRT